MGIINSIKNYFRKDDTEQTQSAPFGNGYDSLLRGQRIVSRPVDATEISYVVACIEKRAKLVSSMEYQVLNSDNEQLEEHPLSKLLQTPNKVFDHTFQQILYLIQTRLDYFGNAYIWCRPSSNGRDVLDIIPIMTNNVKVKASNTRWNHEYEFNISGQTFRIPGKEIIHFKTLALPKDSSFINNHIFGVPRIINSIIPIMTAQKEMIEYIQSYFENDTIPPMIYKNPDGITESQYERLRQNYDVAFGTSTKKPKLLLAEGNGEFTPMDVNKNTFNPSIIKDGLDNTISNQICLAFETPKPLLTNEFKYSDRNQYLQTYKQDVIQPLADYIAKTFELHFQKYYPETIFQTVGLNYINEDLKLEYIDLLARYNAITTDELREAAGYSPLDEPIIEETETEKKKNLDQIQIADEKVIFEYWKKYDDLSESYKDLLNETMIDFFDDLQKHIQSNLKEIDSKNIKAEINQSSEIINLDLMIAELIKNVNPDLIKFIEEIINLALTDVNVDPQDYSKGQEFIRQVLNEVNDLMVEPVATVDKEIKQNITKIIDENPLDNADERLAKIQTMVNNRFDTIYKGSRAETISRTTATSSSESMKAKVFKDTGFDKVWISSRDGKVRDSHRRADRTIADNGGLFEIAGKKARYPADSSLPAKESINCRCRVAAKKKDKLFINGKGYLLK